MLGVRWCSSGKLEVRTLESISHAAQPEDHSRPKRGLPAWRLVTDTSLYGGRNRRQNAVQFSLDAERNDRAVRLRIAVLGASAKIVISSMSLAELASLASSIAVVVSLVFLGLQIRQSNRNQRSLMQQGRSARNVELLSRLSDPRVSDVISRAANGETLTDQDCFVLYGYLTSVFWSYEGCFFQFHWACWIPRAGRPTVPP